MLIVEKLVTDIEQLLCIPRSKASKIVRAILGSMRNALIRGEEVQVRGMGHFTFYMRKARLIGTGDYDCVLKRLKPTSRTKIMKARKIIKFTPTDRILEELNRES